LSGKRELLNPKLIQQLAKGRLSVKSQKSQNGCLVAVAWYQLPAIMPVYA
jgi:hypothetical protein